MTRWPALLLALALAGSGVPDAAALSEKDKERIGRETYEQITASIPVYANERVQQYVRRIGQHIANHSDRPDIEYTFTVLDSSDINAFATPGGYVYVNRGLLAYLDSEAQLAGVLAHEIAHITEEHASRQKSAGTLASIGSTVAAILVGVTTGSGAAANVINDTGQMMGTAMVRGYGRDMELEADREGARFMLAAGYDPQALVDVIGLLKDQESFSKFRSRAEGRKPVSYHGLFSTHPRNDQRLREVINAAGTLDEARRKEPDAIPYRELIQGMKFADEPKQSAVIDNRYYNARLNFTVAFPADWQIVSRGSRLQGSPNRDRTVLQMQVKQADPALTFEQYLESLGVTDLSDGQTFETDDGVAGYMARYPDPSGGPQRRVAVLSHQGGAYLFIGRTGNAELAEFYDMLFRSTINSFRPLRADDQEKAFALTVHYIQAETGTTFEKLAAQSPLPEYPEEQLRILNGYYPRGEPQPGEWIKIVR